MEVLLPKTLPTLGGEGSWAMDMNDAGVVVGTAQLSNGTNRAFRWSETEGMVELEGLGGSNSVAYAINESGVVAGSAWTSGDTEEHAVIWDAEGEVTDLGTLGGWGAWATDINESGEVTGTGTVVVGQTDEYRAFYWGGSGSLQDLGHLGGGHSWAADISENGSVVGESRTSGTGYFQGFVWPGSGSLVGLAPLSGDEASSASNINSDDDVVGVSWDDDTGQSRSVAWDASGVPHELDGGGVATVVNEAGQAAGWSSNVDEVQAFRADLDTYSTEAFVSGSATAINEEGLVAGTAHSDSSWSGWWSGWGWWGFSGWWGSWWGSGEGRGEGFVWDESDGVRGFPSFRRTLVVSAINGDGDVAGTFVDPSPPPTALAQGEPESLSIGESQSVISGSLSATSPNRPPQAFVKRRYTKAQHNACRDFVGRLVDIVIEMGDPVNSATGAYVESHNDFAAIASGAPGLDLVGRTYSTANGFTGRFGKGWSGGVESTLSSVNPVAMLDSDVVYVTPDGRGATFPNIGEGVWGSPKGIDAELVYNASPPAGSSVFSLESATGEIRRFDETGRIVEIDDGNGAVATVDWSGDLPVVATSNGYGFAFVGSGVVEQVDITLDESPVGSVTFDYVDDFLTTVTDPTGRATSYVPDGEDRIAEVRNGENQLVVANVYDEVGRVEEQTLASGDTVTYTYGTLDDQGDSDPANDEWITSAAYADSGETFYYHHNVFGEVVKIVDSDGHPATKGYDNWRTDAFTDRAEAEWRSAFEDTDSDGNGDRLRMRVLPDPDTGVAPAMTDPPNPETQTGAFEFFWYWDEAPGSGAPSGDTRVWKHRNAEGEVTTFTYEGDERIPATQTDNASNASLIESTDGLVTETTDADGVVTVYDWDFDTRRLDSVTVAPGEDEELVTTYTYNTSGRIETEVVDPGGVGATTSYTYDAAGRPETITDPEGGVVARGYDGAGRLWWTSNADNPDLDGPEGPDGHHPSVVYSYRPDGQIASEETLVDHDGEGDPITVTTEYEYTLTGDLEREIHAAGTPDEAVTEYSYGIMGRLESVTDPVGVITQYCYDVNGNQTARLEGLSSLASCGSLSGLSATTTEYDFLGRVEAEVDPEGLRTEYRYDLAGRITHTIAAAGDDAESVTEQVYDDAGRLWKTLTPPPNEETFDWFDTGNDAAKMIEERLYTPAGRLESVSVPNPNLPVHSQTTIEGWGMVWSDTVSTTYTYDSAGRLHQEFTPLANLDAEDDHGPTTYGYDGAGRHNETISPAGRVTTTEYDGAGRVSFERKLVDDTSSQWSSVAYDYTPSGLVESESVPYFGNGPPPGGTAATTYTYNPDGSLESVTDPLGAVTDYAYDNRANRLTRTHYDPGATPGTGLVQQWRYDPADRLIQQWRAPESDPEDAHHAVSYDYDLNGTVADNGLVRQRTDASGRTETYTYDLARRVTDTAYSDGTDSFDVTYNYDSAGRVGVTSRTENSVTDTVTNTWDVLGNLIEEDHPTGETLTWLYGADGQQLRRVPGYELLAYDLDGRLAHTLGAAGWVFLNLGSWNYDPDGLPETETSFELHWGNFDPPVEFWGRGREYDGTGQATLYGQRTLYVDDPDLEIVDEMYPVTFDHDAAGRITAEQRAHWRWDYEADPENWFQTVTDREYTYDEAGQLDQIIDVAPTTPVVLHDYDYSPHGHRTTDTTPAGATAYGWDDIGQLTLIDRPTGNDTTYGYDPAGRRITQTTGDLATTYAWDPAGRLTGREHTDNTDPVWDETRTYDPTSSLTAVDYEEDATTDDVELRWDTTHPIAQLFSWDHNDGTTATPVRIYEGQAGKAIGSTNHAHAQDPYGSNIDVFDPDGPYNIAAAERFDEHGNPTDIDAVPEDPDQHSYLGYRDELQTGDLIHLRNRDYDPTTGTFLTPDPLDGIDGTTTVANPYHYGDNDPLNKTDPLGLQPTDAEISPGPCLDQDPNTLAPFWELGYQASFAHAIEYELDLPILPCGFTYFDIYASGGGPRELLEFAGYFFDVVDGALCGYDIVAGEDAWSCLAMVPVGGSFAAKASKKLTTKGDNVVRRLSSRIKDDPGLVRYAQQAGRSVQRSIDGLTAQLARGNLNPGLGSKPVFRGVYEARARDGARVYFRLASGDGIEILAKSDKGNQGKVISRLRELYE